MLDIKNLMEDIVIEQIEDLEDSKNGLIDDNQKKEIAAYVLNRIKPLYITSNKGFTNLIATYKNDPQFISDLIFIINEALKIIKKSHNSISNIKFEREKLYYVFPKIYGKIISLKTLTPLTEGKVSLYINEILIENVFELWKNPTEILPIDEGIFSFAPKPQIANPPYEKRKFTLKLVIESNDKYYDKILFLEITPSYLTNIKTDFHKNVLQIEDIYVPF